MNEILGARIRSLRESKGFTQEQIAEKLNCTRQKYARIEKGMIDISFSSLTIVAQILEVKVDDITSSLNNSFSNQPVFRTNSNSIQEDKFNFINDMIDTFYAHRRLYNSTRQVDINE